MLTKERRKIKTNSKYHCNVYALQNKVDKLYLVYIYAVSFGLPLQGSLQLMYTSIIVYKCQMLNFEEEILYSLPYVVN